jgi:queuine/archaeosine tRNA-ribosyltransferase
MELRQVSDVQPTSIVATIHNLHNRLSLMREVRKGRHLPEAVQGQARAWRLKPQAN